MTCAVRLRRLGVSLLEVTLEADMEPKKMIPRTTSFAIELREIREKAEAACRAGRIEDLQAALERETRLLRRAHLSGGGQILEESEI